MARIITPRTKYFLTVEGEGEQSLIKLLQHFADQSSDLHIHLDCLVLGGGSYKTMLERTAKYCKKKGDFKKSILLVDTDRATMQDDGWSIDILKQNALLHNLEICLQNPNLEGVLLRILSKKAHGKINTRDARNLLRKIWPTYEKPADAATLKSKFTLEDLLYAAQLDFALNNLLIITGLMPTMRK